MNCKQKIRPFLALCLACVLLLCACGDTKVVLTAGFGKDEVFIIGDETCTLPELMVYLTNVQNQYEEIYGSRIWESSLDGVSLEENVKETVLARIAQVKTMYLMAKDYGVELTEEEESQVAKAAAEYYDSLNEAEIAGMNVTRELLERMYREYALADKVYQELIADINPEVSDDEARSVRIQYIYFATALRNGAGEWIHYSTAEKTKVYARAQEALALATDGEHDFEALAREYSDDETITISFGKGEMNAVVESTAFNLETNQISDILETETGYYILKCLSTLDREETDANKVLIVERQRKETFEKQYDAFVQSLIRNLNDELWESVTFLQDEELTTSDFFEVYSNYFQED
jgi:foldase protein PrsA